MAIRRAPRQDEHDKQDGLAWLGYAREEVVGRLAFASLVAPRQRRAVARAWATLRERGSVHDLEIELRRKDGSVFPVLLSAVAVTDVGGRLVQSRATVFDDYVRERGSSGPLDRLSTRERQVLQLVAEGKTTAEAASVLFLSPKTVETYRSRVMHKLGVRDFAGLVRFAVQHGLTPLE